MSGGEIIGGFQRLKGIGSGGQARVWQAQCIESVPGLAEKGDVVALKIQDVPLVEAAEKFEKLRRRVEDLKRMEHPNVVRYRGCFKCSVDGQPCQVVVQEYLEGETLKERLAKLRLGLDVDEGLRIVKAAADGLAYAAGLRIFHRDIKPGNIFLCADGTVKLIDFGVAKQDGETVDGTSNLRGTFNYMAPDFLADSFSGDEQSDIFSLGVVLHEIVSGKLPYLDSAGADLQGWVSRWRNWSADMANADSPIFVNAMTTRLLEGAYEVIDRALAPNRAKRYANFAEFRRALDTIGFFEQGRDGRTYRRLQWIGKGGCGEVFKARWLEAGAEVAVKQLLNSAYAKRFRTEAKVMRKLQDPCFVKFIDFFETPDHSYLVMQFLDGMPGSSLRDAINRVGNAGLPKKLVLSAFERYARGLSMMHRQKIVHRDIKPGNLYYPVDRPDLVAIMDFGIVRDEDASLTVGMVPCTPDYAPPEIVVSDDRGGPGMDIYALGLCMYEALTGRTGYPRVPAGTAGMMALIERCKAMRQPVFDDPRVTGDPELLAVLQKMTAPELSRRYQDADALAQDLRRLFYRDNDEEDCPTTTVFDVDTDQTQPIDEKRLMEWYASWVKAHPDVDPLSLPVLDLPPAPAPAPRRSWKKTAGVAAAIVLALAGAGAWLALRPEILQALLPAPPPQPVRPPEPPSPDPQLVALKQRLFEKDFAAALADEPVETRRQRLADGSALLAQAMVDKLYADETRLAAFDAALNAASAAVVGKVKNACGCELTVGDEVLSVGEMRLLKFADGAVSNRQMRIFGYDPRPVPAALDGRTLEITKLDFALSSVAVARPTLEEGVQCFFEGRRVTADLSLEPGDYRCEYRRRGYESQTVPFAVELGRPRTLPGPGAWTASPVTATLPRLEADVSAKVDGRLVLSSVALSPGRHRVEYERTGYVAQGVDFVVKLATPLTLPMPGAWKRKEVPKPVQPKPTPKEEAKPVSADTPEIRSLVSDARFYFDDSIYDMVVKCFYEAHKKGYRLDQNDMNLFEHAYKSHHAYLLSEIRKLQNEAYREQQNLRNIEEYKAKLRQLGEWYRAVKQA